MCLFELQFSQGICPVVGLLGHMVVLFSVFKGASILLFIVFSQPFETEERPGKLKLSNKQEVGGMEEGVCCKEGPSGSCSVLRRPGLESRHSLRHPLRTEV